MKYTQLYREAPSGAPGEPESDHVDHLNKRSTNRALLLVLATALTIIFPLAAQIGGAGSIEGTVTDPSGAVIPGATVEATSLATGLKINAGNHGCGLLRDLGAPGRRVQAAG